MSDFFDEQVEEDGDFDDYIVSLHQFQQYQLTHCFFQRTQYLILIGLGLCRGNQRVNILCFLSMLARECRIKLESADWRSVLAVIALLNSFSSNFCLGVHLVSILRCS